MINWKWKGVENPESLLYKGFNSHPNHLTHQFYGATGLVARGETLQPPEGPMGIVKNMRRKADIMVGQAKYLPLAECLFPGWK